MKDIPQSHQHTFDYIVVDPPFITEDVWKKYATTIKLLLKPEGTVHEARTQHV